MDLDRARKKVKVGRTEVSWAELWQTPWAELLLGEEKSLLPLEVVTTTGVSPPVRDARYTHLSFLGSAVCVDAMDEKSFL